MGKNLRRNQMRSHLAYLAARLMAEGGIQDFAQAKQKAARQAGAPDTQSLPDNREIEQALRVYQSLYQLEEHDETLVYLRQEAVRLMEQFAPFNPYLVGSVLTGTASRYSDINLHLFCDSPKDVEIFLLNQNILYNSSVRRIRLGNRHLEVSTLTLNGEGATLSLFHTDDLRIMPKYQADGRPIERAHVERVRELLKEIGQSSSSLSQVAAASAK